jgi:hypothetical protein
MSGIFVGKKGLRKTRQHLLPHYRSPPYRKPQILGRPDVEWPWNGTCFDQMSLLAFAVPF